MTHDELVKEVCLKEDQSRCHDVRIKSISIYHFIRREMRVLYLAQHGYDFKERQAKGNPRKIMLSVIMSVKHLFLMPSRFSVLFRTFRLEDINGTWMDRFYDPIIEECAIKDDYVILETNNGRFYKERSHNDHVFFDDFFSLIAKFCSVLSSFYYRRKYNVEFNNLFSALSTFIPSETINRKFCYDRIITCIYRVKLYKWLLKKKKVKYVVAASRSSFIPLTCAAKMIGVKVYELQHGIVYDETVTYSGYRDKLFTPDKFLLFGDVHPQNLYGIDECSLINIGWALKPYVEKLELKTSISERDVLVLSQPQSTDFIMESMIMLAKCNKEIQFYLRCHPMEKLSDNQIKYIENQQNVHMQDNRISFIMGIAPFKNVVGDQSTAIYEALSYGKKTGLLTMQSHEAKFLQQEDKECFWIINDNASFVEYLNCDKAVKRSMSIYSPFNKESFRNLLKS